MSSQKVTFLTQYTKKPSDIMLCNCVKFEKPSQVKKSLSYATDINTIYDNYCKTGRVPLNGKQPIYDENLFGQRDAFNSARKFGVNNGKLVIVDEDKISLRTLD